MVFKAPHLICTGQATLPTSCPVCDHSPLSSEDCKPNKALRLTVKAFLKNEEKKRDKSRIADASAQSATPVVQDLPAVKEEVKEEEQVKDNVEAFVAVDNSESKQPEQIEGELATDAVNASENAQVCRPVSSADSLSSPYSQIKAEESSRAATLEAPPGEHAEPLDEIADDAARSSSVPVQSIEKPDAQEQTTDNQDAKSSTSGEQAPNASFALNNNMNTNTNMANGFGNNGWNNVPLYNPMMMMPNTLPGADWNNFNMMGMWHDLAIDVHGSKADNPQQA